MVRITVTAALVVLTYLAAASGQVVAQSQPDDQLIS